MKERSEYLEQVTFVNWMKINYPEHRLFSIENGGFRNKATGARLKLSGVIRGVPDIFVPSLFLFIEMKRTKGGIVSKEQKEWISYLNTVGYKAVVCNGFEEAKAVILENISIQL